MPARKRTADEKRATEEAFDKVGPSRIASEVGRSPSTISQWRGDGIPAQHVLDVERLTGVPRWRLRPDIYPRSEFQKAG